MIDIFFWVCRFSEFSFLMTWGAQSSDMTGGHMKYTLFIFALLFVIGSAGALEMDRITIGQAILQMAAGIFVMWRLPLNGGVKARGRKHVK